MALAARRGPLSHNDAPTNSASGWRRSAAVLAEGAVRASAMRVFSATGLSSALGSCWRFIAYATWLVCSSW